jgi:FkbM family methyltransferase
LGLDGPVERDILGNRMRLDPGRPGLDQDLLLHGIREPVATGHLMRLLGPQDVVLEAGANIGYYALLEARLCRRVYAVEPHPENLHRLKGHLAMNEVENVEPYHLAFGPSDGPLHLRCSPLSNWHSCLGAAPGGDQVIEVPGVTIDNFVATREAPTFIRMDIEGFEMEALRGARRTLRQVRGLFLELHGPYLTIAQVREVLDLLQASGLEPALIVQYDWPGLARVHPPSHVERIRAGDRCTYELFFERPASGRG